MTTSNATWLRTSALLVALAAATGCAASEGPLRPNDSIPFVDHGGVRDWQVESPHAMRIQSASGDWYRATFAFPCRELRWHQRVGFLTDATHEIDRFGGVLAGGEVCRFKSFEKLPRVAADALPNQG